MADKYLEHDLAGGMREKEAIDASAGAGDSGKIVALDTTGRLDTTMMPVGIGADLAVLETSEAVSQGDWVNLHNDTSVTKVRKADATDSNRDVSGFVLESYGVGAQASVYFEGINTFARGSLTAGAVIFLSPTVPGEGTITPPSSTTNIVQKVGRALSTSSVQFEASNPITLV